MSEKKDIEDIKSKTKTLTNQLTYIKKPYTFSNILKNYNGKINELHRFLFHNTSFKPSSFKASINIARGIIKKIPNILTKEKIKNTTQKQNPQIYNKKQNKPRNLTITINKNQNKNNGDKIINHIIKEINESNTKTKTKISKKIEKKGPQIFTDASKTLNYLNIEYKNYLEEYNLTKEKNQKNKTNRQLKIDEIIEATTSILTGSLIVLNSIDKSNKNNLYSGLILIAFVFVKYPNLEKQKNQKHTLSINQTKLNDF